MSSEHAYNDGKALYHIDELMAIRNGSRPHPIHVQLVLTDKCNQQCLRCAYADRGGAMSLSDTKLTQIIDDCHNMRVKAIQFTGGGEPLCHPLAEEHITRALDHNFSVGVVTNGVLMSESLATKLRNEADWVRISFDAASPKTYASIRHTNQEDYYKALRSLRRISGGHAMVGVSYLACHENEHDISSALAVFQEHGANYVRFTSDWRPQAMNDTDSARIFSRCATAKQNATSWIMVINQCARYRRFLELGPPTIPRCWIQRLAIWIGADAKIYRCCSTAYSDLGLLGSIEDRSLMEAWPTLDFTHDARQCGQCSARRKNELLDAILGPEPLHAEFV